MRIRRAAPWGLLAVSLAGCGVFGPAGLNSSVGDMLSAWALMLSLTWLAVRGARRLAAGRRWRRGGGRVIGGQSGPTVAELAREVADLRETVGEHGDAIEMIGRSSEADARRARFRVVPRRGA